MNKRIIPTLLFKNGSLVKTEKFKHPFYIGDPINTIRIFNEFEVDELFILDINSYKSNFKINYDVLKDIATESFMPLTYGGGISTIDDIKIILNIGFEKVILNTAAVNNPNLITEAVNIFGSQAIVCSIDFKKNFWGNYYCYSACGHTRLNINPHSLALHYQNLGAGEIFITDINREGTWSGLNIDLAASIGESLNIPLILNGGANSPENILNALNSSISAVSASSIFLYYKKESGILINFPENLIDKKMSYSN
jgi:cyclase